MYIKVSAITRYVPFETSTFHSHAPFGVLGHKMTNDTKCTSFKMQGILAPYFAPKFSIELSRDALREGRDTQLETAVEVAKTM